MRAAIGNGGCGEVFSHIQLIKGRNHMSLKHISAAVAASALLASVAFAQTPTTTSDRNNMAASETSSSSSSFQGDWRASKVVGLSVYNDNNQSIGSINDLLTDKSGNIKAAVIGVGGFLGQDQIRQRAGFLYQRLWQCQHHALVDNHDGFSLYPVYDRCRVDGDIVETQSVVPGPCRV
jgi:hypothetical protein